MNLVNLIFAKLLMSALFCSLFEKGESIVRVAFLRINHRFWKTTLYIFFSIEFFSFFKLDVMKKVLNCQTLFSHLSKKVIFIAFLLLFVCLDPSVLRWVKSSFARWILYMHFEKFTQQSVTFFQNLLNFVDGWQHVNLKSGAVWLVSILVSFKSGAIFSVARVFPPHSNGKI